MYYPIQIPYVLNKAFSQNIKYMEEPAEECGGFVICFWETQALSECVLPVTNIIVTDGCIDIVVNFDERIIGFSGMSKTNFDYQIESSARFMGARLMPGAFHQLTGISASVAMDAFLPITAVYKDFDSALFFSSTFNKAKEYLKAFLANKTKNKTPNTFTSLFPDLSIDTPTTTTELYQRYHYSPRQCQRLFTKHYGITPKAALSIIRFQKCLKILTSSKIKPVDILSMTEYYDQPHLIKDFRRNIGITPLELVRIYQN